MNIAILLFDGFTALDAIGPYEVLSRLPGARVTFVAAEPGPVRTDNGMLALVAERSLDDAAERPTSCSSPAASATRALTHGDARARVARAPRTRPRTWTTSVCTGSLILAAAGLLDGQAGDHALAGAGRAARARRRADAGARRVEQGKIITAAGVSAGIDMALTLAARIAGDDVAQAIQLGIEYDPQPPFDAGSPEKAPAEIVALLPQRRGADRRRSEQRDRRRRSPATGTRRRAAARQCRRPRRQPVARRARQRSHRGHADASSASGCASSRSPEIVGAAKAIEVKAAAARAGWHLRLRRDRPSGPHGHEPCDRDGCDLKTHSQTRPLRETFPA